MISVPLPFVLALMHLMLLGIVLAKDDSGPRRVAWFLALCVTLLVVVGLRWTFDVPVLRFLQPVVAALVPAAAWFCFAPLRDGRAAHYRIHLIPAGLALIASMLWPWIHLPVDGLLAVLFIGYGLALLRFGLTGPDALTNARFSAASSAGRAGMLGGGGLILSGLVDAAVAVDFGLGDGSHAAGIVTMGSMLMLPLIGVIMMKVAAASPQEETTSAPTAMPAFEPLKEDGQVLERVTGLLSERHLYRDPDLTLDRLSRRLGIPARQVSGAINRTYDRNVSQFINEWRIREAMLLLSATDAPVTQVMFDCGFQTKSNFNREFRRVAGSSPSEWRGRQRPDAT